MTQPRAALYMRAATAADTDDPRLDAQRGLLCDYAKANDYAIVREYRDVGSGRQVDRPGLQQLMADAETGLFETLLMTEPSRLFRDFTLFGQHYHRLRHELGVAVVFVVCENAAKGGGA